MENQLQFFSWLGLQIDSSNIDEWYNVSSRVLVEDNGGDELLGNSRLCPIKVLAKHTTSKGIFLNWLGKC